MLEVQHELAKAGIHQRTYNVHIRTVKTFVKILQLAALERTHKQAQKKFKCFDVVIGTLSQLETDNIEEWLKRVLGPGDDYTAVEPVEEKRGDIGKDNEAQGRVGKAQDAEVTERASEDVCIDLSCRVLCAP